jgi:hemoglobin/transferrin/lactoferrin receptor protein
VEYTQNDVSRHISAVQVVLSYQRPSEMISRITASDPYTVRHHRDLVDTGEVSVQLTSRAGNSQVFTYGFNSNADSVTSTRKDENLRTGVLRAKAGNYVDGSRFAGIAVFAQDEVRLSNRLDGVFGLRYDRFRLNADLSDSSAGGFTVRGDPAAVSGSGYLLYRLTKHWSATGGFSQAFRAPNVDDSTILGGVGSRFEIPNGELKPEHSVDFEYGVRAQARSVNVNIAVFQDYYRDLIDRAPALLNGLPYLDLNANGKKDGQEQDIFQRQNISRAAVNGFEIEAMIEVAEGWTWTHTTTWTRGTDRSLGEPLTRIPPLNGASRITWQTKRPYWFEAAAVGASPQHRLAPADRTDIRIGPGGTAGYLVFHLRAGFSRTVLAGLSLALENLTDRQYRLHGSGLDRSGRNLVVGYARSF